MGCLPPTCQPYMLCFSSYQISAMVWGIPSEPDVTNRWSLYREVPFSWESGTGGSMCSQVPNSEGEGSLDSEVQCIIGNVDSHQCWHLAASGKIQGIMVYCHVEPLSITADIWWLLIRSNTSWVMVSWNSPLLWTKTQLSWLAVTKPFILHCKYYIIGESDGTYPPRGRAPNPTLDILPSPGHTHPLDIPTPWTYPPLKKGSGTRDTLWKDMGPEMAPWTCSHGHTQPLPPEETWYQRYPSLERTWDQRYPSPPPWTDRPL